MKYRSEYNILILLNYLDRPGPQCSSIHSQKKSLSQYIVSPHLVLSELTILGFLCKFILNPNIFILYAHCTLGWGGISNTPVTSKTQWADCFWECMTSLVRALFLSITSGDTKWLMSSVGMFKQEVTVLTAELRHCLKIFLHNYYLANIWLGPGNENTN